VHRKQTTIRKSKNTKEEDRLLVDKLLSVDTAKKTNVTTKRKRKDREDNSKVVKTVRA